MVRRALSILVFVGLFKLSEATLGLSRICSVKRRLRNDLESSLELENIKTIYDMGVGELVLISSNCLRTSTKSDNSLGL
jgi:hypothetical protein